MLNIFKKAMFLFFITVFWPLVFVVFLDVAGQDMAAVWSEFSQPVPAWVLMVVVIVYNLSFWFMEREMNSLKNKVEDLCKR